MVPMIEGLVMSFGCNDCNRVYKWVEELGGFDATDGIWVTKRHTTVRSKTYSGSRDYSTGLKTNLVDDITEMKRDMLVMQDGVGRLESIVRQMGPDVFYMRNALMELEGSVWKKFDEGMNDFVGEVGADVRAYLDVYVAPNSAIRVNARTNDECDYRIGEGDIKEQPQTTAGLAHPPDKPTATKMAGVHRMKFGNVADLSPEDKDLMAYLASHKCNGGDMLRR
ncbi:uncharacterized protein LOC126787389 [Argentina anserina]|uniref:uncharacterized protein LOC126787389 n=1 Tax=Argentina anserina TaxID=57926 RepID=UPI002176671C|nr:uncharacterized protein LOC126787389 [Potentilla anserina]